MSDNNAKSVLRKLRRRGYTYDPETGVIARNGRELGKGKSKYLRLRVGGKCYLGHRVAWLFVHGRWPADSIDHINCNPRDNRIANLRECSQQLNLCNRPAHKDNKSGLKGAYQNAKGYWYSTITHNRTVISLGCFESAEKAHEAWAAKAIELRGAYARTR